MFFGLSKMFQRLLNSFRILCVIEILLNEKRENFIDMYRVCITKRQRCGSTWQIFHEIKTYRFVEFTSQLKIGLSSIERIYQYMGFWKMPRLVYMVTKQMMCLKQTQFLIFCYCPEMKVYGALNKHPDFLQRYKIIHKQP